MDGIFILTIFIVIFALAFDFINGFHDTANAIATSVSTKLILLPVIFLVFFNTIKVYDKSLQFYTGGIPNYIEMAYELFLYQNKHQYYQVPQFSEQYMQTIVNSFTTSTGGQQLQ